jgi:hypothetical protein
MSVVKDEVTSLLERLPEDASIEDVQYQLYVVEKIRNGLEAARTEETFTQQQAEEKLGKWLVQ